MDLGDILNDLPEDPEEQKRKHQLFEELNALRDRLAAQRLRDAVASRAICGLAPHTQTTACPKLSRAVHA
jgi:hypothetical protein